MRKMAVTVKWEETKMCGRPWELREPEMASKNRLKLSHKKNIIIEHLISPGPVLDILLSFFN